MPRTVEPLRSPFRISAKPSTLSPLTISAPPGRPRIPRFRSMPAGKFPIFLPPTLRPLSALRPRFLMSRHNPRPDRHRSRPTRLCFHQRPLHRPQRAHQRPQSPLRQQPRLTQHQCQPAARSRRRFRAGQLSSRWTNLHLSRRHHLPQRRSRPQHHPRRRHPRTFRLLSRTSQHLRQPRTRAPPPSLPTRASKSPRRRLLPRHQR